MFLSKNNVILIINLMTAFIILSCGPTHPDETIEYIRVKVDSVGIPTGILHQTDTLVINFYGVIGNDECYSFSHYQGSFTLSEADLTVWGIHKETTSGKCAQIIVYLDGRQFRIFPIKAGLYSLRIHQPDGSTLIYTKEISL